MEHSLLHAVLLWSLIVVTGGPFLVLGLRESPGSPAPTDLGQSIRDSAAAWVFYAATLGGVAVLLDLLVEVAEAQGRSVFAGVSIADTIRFAGHTHVGRLSLARAVVLFATGAVARLWRTRTAWWVIASLAFGAILMTSLVSHAAAQPAGRGTAMLAQIVHIAGAALWLGVLFHLLMVRKQIEGASAGGNRLLVAAVIQRFSPVALAAISILLMSGLAAACRFVGHPSAMILSAYGLTLIVKLTLLAAAFYAGLVNFRVIRPRLIAIGDSKPASSEPTLRRFGRMLELEVTSGLLVLAVAGILASVSPPGENQSVQLTREQAGALLSAKIPAMDVPDPVTFYGAPARTQDDLRYSEFTHHYSGMIVSLLGLCWLLQSLGGKIGSWCGVIWPWLLVPFGVFVAIASDPEIWWLRRLSIDRVFSDPQLIEHQLGAAMIFGLVWLGWRDGRRPAARRPLGYALPAIMMFGSLLLLGHAHSTLSASDPLLNLINVQHAVFGAFGLFAGAVRWLSLRGLFPQSIARWLWPGLVIGLGLFMTFYYRELI